MLSVDRMRVLHAIAANGSLTGAAEELRVTNSAVSQQLSKLEREVGQPLVERNGRGIRLTEAAEVLVEHTGQILSLVRQAEADLEAHRDAVIGHLRLAAIATAARGLVPHALVALRESHPRLAVELVEQEPHESIPAVSRGEADMAVVVDWTGAPLPLPRGMERTPLMEDIADLALPSGHPLAHRGLVALDEVVDLPWISWPRGGACGEWLHRMISEQGNDPRIVHTAEEHQTQLALVAAGLGAAVMPRLGRGPVPEGVRLVQVQPALVRQVYVFWNADAARRPAISATVRALRDAALNPEAATASVRA
ncbi:LysR family transcriptional regulator [Nocardiopsis chromatogenes]|uniref:LysR family transcriptional regulator n=1 Tax=Nocardiopsis chromatogenes TaxID=280239 RepID=UPI00047562A5|nr:LysR family transcriptional regulator [Nocardiopsis chromatogenes]